MDSFLVKIICLLNLIRINQGKILVATKSHLELAKSYILLSRLNILCQVNMLVLDKIRLDVMCFNVNCFTFKKLNLQ